MGLIAKANGGGSFTPVPPGNHLARCYRIIDLGTQRGEYKGQVKWQQKCMLQFEVHGVDEDGNPLVTPKGEPLSISKNYTVSLNDGATMRTDFESWRNRAFTPEERNAFHVGKVLGQWAMISVTKSIVGDKEYTNIAGIATVPSMMKANIPKGINDLKTFDLDNPDMALFETFGERLKEKIMGSKEWVAHLSKDPSTTQSIADGLDDDIPF